METLFNSLVLDICIASFDYMFEKVLSVLQKILFFTKF